MFKMFKKKEKRIVYNFMLVNLVTGRVVDTFQTLSEAEGCRLMLNYDDYKIVTVER